VEDQEDDQRRQVDEDRGPYHAEDRPAGRRVAGAAARLKRELGDQLPGSFSATVVPAREQAVGEVRASLLLLMGAVALVLLIACINVANLFLARGDGRKRELAVRTALGAGTGRLARQFLTESLLLAGLGGAAGVGLAAAGTRVLVAAAPPELPRSGEIGLDLSVLAFAAALTLAVTAVFGLLPALRTGRRPPRTGLGVASRGTTGGRGGRRLRWVLVVSEIALATALGVTAVLMSRSAVNLGAQDAGFDAERALAFEVSPPDARYSDATSVRAFYDRLLTELRSAPGAVAVGGNSNLPLAETPGDWGVHIRGRGGEEGRSDVSPDWHVATEGFFGALAIPVVEGRTFGPRDTEEGRQVVVVNRELARRGWPEGDALGGQLRMTTDVDTIWRTVVGVVGDVRHRSLREPPRPAMYLPHAQFPNSSPLVVSGLDVVVRTSAEPAAVTSFVRRAVRELDPAVPVADLRTMETVRRTATVSERFLGGLVAGFATLATMLVLVGTYGVVAYLVGRRMPEMGVRLSLGASPARLRSLVVRESLRMAVLGIGAGVLGALAASRILTGFLYGVSPVDPATYVTVPALLLAVAAAAAWLPARRAARVDPVAVLRAE
jgi:predicted permease